MFWDNLNGQKFSTLDEGVGHFIKQGWRVVEKGEGAVKLGLWTKVDDDPIAALDEDLPVTYVTIVRREE